MLLPTQTSWVILAGGQASRMGGRDKGLVELNGRPLIQYVIDKLSQQNVSITINANRNQERYQDFAPVVSDSFPDYPGPLGGIHAGLKNADTDWVGFVPCDSPQINEDLVERFCAAVNPDRMKAVGRLKRPSTTRTPPTSSIGPDQPASVDRSTTPPRPPGGKPRIFCAPC